MKKTLMRWTLPAIALAALLTGCGNSEAPSTSHGAAGPSSTAADQSAHNDADATFAQQMVPHHQQALEMAKLAASRASSVTVKDLAGRIEKAQDPEIQQMSAWLTQWGATTSTSGMPGMDHGSATSAMPGMMSDAEMRQLQQANGAEFDRMFLDMMIKHHQGAIQMARTELDQGTNTAAKALAQRIIDAQQAEITEMQGLLTSM